MLDEARNRLAEDGDRVLSALGCYVVDVEVERGRTRPRLRYFIGQLDDLPVGVERCAAASRALTSWLDESGEFGGEYALEVSSPGIDRRVGRPRDFIRFAGRPVRVKVKTPLDGQRNIPGVILRADEKSVTLLVGEAEVTLAYGQVARANLAPDLSNGEG